MTELGKKKLAPEAIGQFKPVSARHDESRSRPMLMLIIARNANLRRLFEFIPAMPDEEAGLDHAVSHPFLLLLLEIEAIHAAREVALSSSCELPHLDGLRRIK